MNASDNHLSDQELLDHLAEMGPWHQNIALRETVSTVPGRGDARRKAFTKLMGAVYPGGLSGKAFIDAACNAGAFCFWAKELGAQEALGFDVRDHWISQASFIQKHREIDSTGITFRQLDLYDLPELGDRTFDIAWFSGIFYHLPDPVTGLKLLADRTRELLYISTASRTPQGEEPGGGCMYLAREGTESPMSGVYALNWLPSGPRALTHILNWLGFPEVRVLSWTKRISRPD